MPLDPNLLNVLSCPQCHIDLIYKKVGKQEELICPHCLHLYSIIDGIPQMFHQKSVKH